MMADLLDVAGRARGSRVVGSALWAATGDALGWITELADAGAVEARSGRSRVSAPVSWKRLVGGRGGVRVDLPAGTYSDDTQLRLAVSRCISDPTGFDAEAFARVELTVWQSYGLGAGLGSKAAAANLAKRGVNWFSNFFDQKQKYVAGGGNGAAMRIQPHVWSWSKAKRYSFESQTLKDAVVTHGHPHGFCGALFHAFAVSDAIESSKRGGLEDWFAYADKFGDVVGFVEQDQQMAAFWRGPWEERYGESLFIATNSLRDETLRLLEQLTDMLTKDPLDAYRGALNLLGCTTARFRGSGVRTAIAASVLSHLIPSPHEALVVAANELESDTDTICTMAGAILGATAPEIPRWPLQDRKYIEREAIRMAEIAVGQKTSRHGYPDLAKWSPPATHSDAMILTSDGYALLGLGRIAPRSQEYVSGDFVWQWFEAEFGQSFFVKRRRDLRVLEVAEPAVPARVGQAYGSGRSTDASPRRYSREPSWLDAATDRVVQSEFDERVIGRLLLETIDNHGGLEGAIAFSAVVAKARIARRRHRSS